MRSKPRQSFITKAELSQCRRPSRSSDGLCRPAVSTYCICQHSRKLHLTGLLSLLKTMTQPLSFSSVFFFFFPSTEAEISNEAKRKMILLSERERERSLGSDLSYLGSIVVSIRSTNRGGHGHGARFAAAFMALWLPWLLDPEQERKKSNLRETVLMYMESSLHRS